MRLFLRLALMLALVMASACAYTSPPQYVEGVILVKYKAGVSDAVRQKIISRHGSRAIGQANALGVQKISAPKGNEKAHCRAFVSEADVEYAEPDYIALPLRAHPDVFGGKNLRQYKKDGRVLVWLSDLYYMGKPSYEYLLG